MDRSSCFVDFEHAMDTERFCGRNKPQQWKLRRKMRKLLHWLVEREDSTNLVCSMDLGIGMYAAEEILKMKKKNPHITLECYLPYEGYWENWSQKDKDTFFSIIKQCDKKTYYQHSYTEGCVRAACRQMIADNWLVVAHWLGTPREMGKLVAEAIQMGKQVVVFDMDSF